MDYPTTAAAISAAVNHQTISCRDVIAAHLQRIEQFNERTNAFTEVLAERAMARADYIDKSVNQGRKLPLAGVPFAAKNLFNIKGSVTLAGAKINATNPAETVDALAISRLEQAGGVLVGALHMGEYAYDFTGENAHFGPCRNPWNLAHMTGGSSSGSGAALAAGLVPLTLGTDTNGSIRVPSSFCGLWGLKPTYGRLPRTGAYPFCDSLDHIGPMTRDLQDLRVAYNALQGYCDSDPACVNRPAAPIEITAPARPLRVAIAEGYFRDHEFAAANAQVDTAAQALASMGCVVSQLKLPMVRAGRSAAFLITNIEAAAFHRQRLRRQPMDFDPETRDRLLAGSLLPAAWYVNAQRVRQHYASAVAHAMTDIDILLAPATPFHAPKTGTKTFVQNGQEVGLRANIGYFTQPISCIGLPVVCAPVQTPGQSPGSLPLGVQLIGKPWREDQCFQAAELLRASGHTHSEVAPGFH